ncbi:MAG: hypothetical protein ACYCV4_02430 [Dermatophilaceae bacterium]
MADKNQLLRALAGLLDTEPRHFDLHVTSVNPSGEGSWIAGTDLGGMRVYGEPAEQVADAVRNLFFKLTGRGGYRDDGDVRVALEMALAGKGVVESFVSGPQLASSSTVLDDDDDDDD